MDKYGLMHNPIGGKFFPLDPTPLLWKEFYHSDPFRKMSIFIKPRHAKSTVMFTGKIQRKYGNKTYF